ncbi:ABC transporter ATP-binding protein [Geovibrio thiophilus]|uniref:ABC transporter ATP-binding protein n=2 Tax=Geovibrio thiophilus TaxID=139438 RepID=A0A3R5Z187_9BACT|nr:ABC transporter ATP-binding protein [Geovibrio thiophilus]
MERTDNISGIKRLLEIAGTKKKFLIASMLLSVTATALQFVPVTAVYFIISELAENASDIHKADVSWLYRLGFISLGAVGIAGIMLYAAFMCSHIAAFNILYELRVKLSEKLTKLSMGFFTNRTTGGIKKIMTEDVERIELFVAHHIPDITGAVVFPVFTALYLFFTDWRMALALFIPLGAALYIQTRMFSSNDLYREFNLALENMNSAVAEYVKGMPVVKVFNADAESFESLKKSVYSFRDLAFRITKQYALIYPAFLTVLSAPLLFLIPAAGYFGLNTEDYTAYAPKIFLFLILGSGMFFPFLKLIFMVNNLRQITVGLERVDGVLNMEEMREPSVPAVPDDSSVEFADVTFSYGNESVLKDVSFRVEAGSVTAIVGPSGAGKSTVGMLAARFWDIQDGEIKIGGVNIKDMSTEILMNHVSFVFQENFLFFDTIEENIRMGNTDAAMDDVVNAAKAACCHEFIENLPDGYATLVGEGGTYLSGGEQQRVAIARAILKNSPVLILDEATAYADPDNEGRILEAFSKLIKDKTVLVIAHRLSTVRNAGQIIVMDRGRITERGIHEELVSADGLYAKMWRTYSYMREWKIDVKKGGRR